MKQTLILFVGAAVAVAGCSDLQPAAKRDAECYVRYLKPESQLLAEISFREIPSGASESQPWNPPGGVRYQGSLMRELTLQDVPMYRFETQSVATQLSDPEKAKSDLDLIQVVPNPYYAYAGGDGYERNALDNRIKITNLPERCTISIYNVNGTLIRQITKDEPKTSVDWDLKNFAGVPIAGGVYIIHVKADNGEKILKWFGGLRVPDLNVF